jgi:hypothetical protein
MLGTLAFKGSYGNGTSFSLTREEGHDPNRDSD